MDIAAGAVVVICWGCTPLIKRSLTSVMSPHEFSILNHTMSTILFVFFAAYLVYTGGLDLKKYQGLSSRDMGVVFMISFATVASSLCLLYLLQRTEASRVVAIVQPLAILTTLISGVFFAAESFDRSKVLGCMLVCAGVAVLAYKV